MTYISEPDFISIILEVKPTNKAKWKNWNQKPRDWWGKGCQNALLNSLPEEISNLLCKENERHPYTASSLIGYDHKKHLFDTTYQLRYTSIARQAATAILGAAINGPLSAGKPIEVDHIPFKIIKSYWEEEQHPDAYTGLWPTFEGQFLLIDFQYKDTFTLQFASPTYFKVKYQPFEPFPFPRLIFNKNLFHLWEKYVGTPLEVHLGEDLFKYIAPIRTNHLRTIMLTERHKKQPIKRVGISGRITYQFLTEDKNIRRTLSMLAAFTVFTGAGKATSVGFGQVRLIPDQNKK